MSATATATALAQAFARDGYVIVRGVFAADELAAVRSAFFALADAGKVIPGLFHAPEDATADDPLRRYPRVMHPHAHPDLPVGPLAMSWMLDPRLLTPLRELMGEEPVGVQTMFYFKPPGARGQAFHQDNYYLQSQPGSCVAAWIAVDRVDPDNGGLSVIPGSHRLPVLPVRKSDTTQSFVDVQVDPPAGVAPVPTILDPGDVLFFGGQLIHGSTPNRSKDRFRSSFIAHYVGARTTSMSPWYNHRYLADGSKVDFAPPPGYQPVGMAATAAKKDRDAALH